MKKQKKKKSVALGVPAKGASAGPKGDIRQVRDLLSGEVQKMGPLTDTASRDFVAKLIALNKAQLLLLRAERALDEQAGQSGVEDSHDMAGIRDSIGRKLDRLRTETGAGEVSGDADTD